MKVQDRYALLDGLRGFCALAVLFFHVGHWLHIPNIAPNGNLAVDFFFCLSGYVLGLIYSERLVTKMSARTFIVIRLWRLMPIIIVATLISATFVLVRSVVQHQPLDPILFVTFLFAGLVNLPVFHAPLAMGGPQVFPLNGPQYTLFLELLANSVWGLLRRLHTTAFLIASCAVCAVLVAQYGFAGDETRNFWIGIPRVFLSFDLGLLVFYLGQKKEGHQSLAAWTYIPPFLLMAGMLYYPAELPQWLRVIWAVAVSPLLIWWGSRVKLEGRLAEICVTGGLLSFPIYALHYPVFCWVNGIYQAVMRGPSRVFEPPLIVLAVVVASWQALVWLDYHKLRSAWDNRFQRQPAKA